jgi:selenocysteine-specific elongation factor
MILATAGHIDHGKTALVRALTGVDADRLPEEKRRGLTIDLGFAYATLPDGTELGFVDVPGHERFLPNMLAGILSIDRVLLIVAADDGPRPQTLEHLDVLELIGVAEVTGVITKIDRVPAERLAAVEAEIAALLAEAGYADSPIYPVSSRTGEGIPALAEHLREGARAAAASRAAQQPTGGFRLAIDRAFSLSGIGLVVTGTATAGAVAVGDRLCLSPRGIEVRVRGVHAHNRPAERARAGDRVALNLAGSFPEGAEPERGDWVIDPALHKPVSRVDLAITLSRMAPAPLRDGLPVHFHLGTEDLVGRLAILGARSLAPGERGLAQVDFERPIAALWGDRAIIRDHMARHTLAGGRVLDPGPPRRGRQRPERLSVLNALAQPDAGDALEALLDGREATGVVALAPFAQARNLPLAEIEALVEAGGFRLVGTGSTAIAVGAAKLARLGEAIVAALTEWHRGQPDALGPARGALFARLRGEAPDSVLDGALAMLLADGRVVRERNMLRLPEHQARLSREDERLWARVEKLLVKDALRPPRVRELAVELGLEPEKLTRFLKRVERFGRLAAVAPNRFFPPETVARLADVAAELAAESPEQRFTASVFKDRSGIGRNLTIEVLEYLDRIGATKRVGDARIVLRRADELFG